MKGRKNERMEGRNERKGGSRSAKTLYTEVRGVINGFQSIKCCEEKLLTIIISRQKGRRCFNFIVQR